MEVRDQVVEEELAHSDDEVSVVGIYIDFI